MDTSSPLAFEQILVSGRLDEYLGSLQSTKYLAVACFCLLIYDYLLTLEHEVHLFWRRKFTITRVLFFLNRYLPPLNSIVVLAWFFRREPSYEFCQRSMWSTSLCTVLELIIMQAILVARVVHLWTWRQKVQRLVFSLYLVCLILVISFFAVVMNSTQALVLPIPLNGCFDATTGPNGHLYWAMLVPTFIMETALVVLTVIRVAGPLQKSQYNNRILLVLFRDGCMFYACVFACVGFAVIGAAMWDHPQVAFPAIFSGFLPIVLSICASRLLFNLHELAEELIGQPAFALNDVELRRLNLRKGPGHGEFIVDMQSDFHEPALPQADSSFIVLDLKNLDANGKTKNRGGCSYEQMEMETEWLPYIKRLSRFRIGSRATWGWTS